MGEDSFLGKDGKSEELLGSLYRLYIRERRDDHLWTTRQEDYMSRAKVSERMATCIAYSTAKGPRIASYIRTFSESGGREEGGFMHGAVAYRKDGWMGGYFMR